MATEQLSFHEDELNIRKYPYKTMGFKLPSVQWKQLDDGCFLLSSGIELNASENSIPALFSKQASRFPERNWLSQKSDVNLTKPPQGDWHSITYGEFERLSNNAAQWMLNRNMGQNTPLMILSENSIHHALLAMAAMKAQVPIAPVSPQYALMDKRFTNLKMIFTQIAPSVVFAQDADRYKNALNCLNECAKIDIITSNTATSSIGELTTKHVLIDELLLTPSGTQVQESICNINQDTLAKYLFTSGSTGCPKGVAYTQTMLCAQVAALSSLRLPIKDQVSYPVYLQWMPWSHVSAGNISYHEALALGGSIYIDDGKPVAGLFDNTLANLKQLSPTIFGSAPIGLDWLASALEDDITLQECFFKNLEAITYGGAALNEKIVQRLQVLAINNIGKRIPIISMYGSTETQGITVTYWPSDLPGVIGLPVPGVTLKLVPIDKKLAIRAKGPTVFSGYLKQASLTATSCSPFDEDGFYKLGDAVRFAVDMEPLEGLVFDGRLSEDFKLSTGTWVSTNLIKSKLHDALAPFVKDLVILGENQDAIVAFAWLDKAAITSFTKMPERCTATNKEPYEKSIENAIQQSTLLEIINEQLAVYNQNNSSSSRRIKRLMLMSQPLSMAKGEINEKGTINPRVVINVRQTNFSQLYVSECDENNSVLTDIPKQ